jgi:hypothetical protein
MAALIKRRTKMVSIRLLDDEYHQLKQLCVTNGARSVSDLAREAMFRMLNRPAVIPADANLEDRVRMLAQTVNRLGEKMEVIEGKLGARSRGAAT